MPRPKNKRPVQSKEDESNSTTGRSALGKKFAKLKFDAEDPYPFLSPLHNVFKTLVNSDEEEKTEFLMAALPVSLMGSSTPMDGTADELLKAITKNGLRIPDQQNGYSGGGETFCIKMFTERARKRKADEDFAKYALFLLELAELISFVLGSWVPAETVVECFAEGANAKQADAAYIKVEGFKLGEQQGEDSGSILKQLAKLVQVREQAGRSAATVKAAVVDVHQPATMAATDEGRIAQIVERTVLATMTSSGWKAPDSTSAPGNVNAGSQQASDDQRRFKDSAGPDECFRCGLKGHTTRGCVAKKDKNGKELTPQPRRNWRPRGSKN